MKNAWTVRGILTVVLLVLTVNARAAVAKSETPSAQDIAYLTSSAQDDIFEITLARTTITSATDRLVRDHCRKVVTDRTKHLSGLYSIARKKGIALPHRMNTSQQVVVNFFKKLDPSLLGRAYIKFEVESHANDLAEAQLEAQRGTDDDVKKDASDDSPHQDDNMHDAVTDNVKIEDSIHHRSGH